MWKKKIFSPTNWDISAKTQNFQNRFLAFNSFLDGFFLLGGSAPKPPGFYGQKRRNVHAKKTRVFSHSNPDISSLEQDIKKTLQWDSALVFCQKIPLSTFPTRYLCRAGKVELHLQNRWFLENFHFSPFSEHFPEKSSRAQLEISSIVS